MNKTLTPVARNLRSNSTEAEKHLWQALRFEGLGVKFRRQAIIGPYIVDFVCFKNELVIEVDGVAQKIKERLNSPSLTLPTRGREISNLKNLKTASR